MSEEVHRLVTKLDKLHTRRSKAITKLVTIDDKITTTLKAATVNKQVLTCSVSKPTIVIPQSKARVSAGVFLVKGNIAETITIREFFELKAKVLSIRGDKVIIQYIRSKKETPRKSNKLLKLSS